jgi:TldD protein
VPDSPDALSASDSSTAAHLRERFAFLPEIVAGMERQVPYASAMMRSRSGLRLSLRDAEQTVERLDPQEGIVLTASNGYGLEEAATDETDAAAVRRLADALVERAMAYRPPDGQSPLEIEGDSAVSGDFATPMEQDPADLPLADKVARYDALRRALRDKDKRTVQAICQYTDQEVQQVFAHRGGLNTQQIRRMSLALIPFLSDGSRQEYSYLARTGTGGLEQIEMPDEALSRVSEEAASMLGAVPMPPGTYDVVTDPETSGVIAHEAFGHGMETDMFLKERARAADYIGKRVGSDLVNIVDDPSMAGAYGSYFVDDEGRGASPTQIIRDGILQGGMTDLYSASRLGISRTANGRRESVHRKAYARMSNTFFTPGSSTREELLGSLDDGVLLRQTLNGMEDPKGWGIQIWALFAVEYKHGQPTGRIFSPVAITGYVPDVLADVSMVSNDFALVGGTCGKGWKELVPVTSGGPYLRTRCRLA